MKKLITILCAGLITIGLSAQTDQGTMYVGAGLSNASGFSYESNDEDAGDYSSMSLEVNGGYFVINNLAVMAGLSYSKEGDWDAETGFGIGARYYINGSIFPFLMYEIPGEKQSDIVIGCGYAVMLNDNVAFEPMLSYTMHSYDGNSGGATIALGFGLGVHF